MNYNLPYYGKKGTICKINEGEKYYLVYRYDVGGKDTKLFKVPKTMNNYNLLLENYYNDLAGYLQHNEKKYNKCKEERLNREIDKGLASTLTTTALTMFGASIPMVLTHEALGYLGMSLMILSMPILGTGIKLTIKNNDNKKNKKYIEFYNKLEEKLRIYNDRVVKVKEQELTKYVGLNKEEDNDKVREMNFVNNVRVKTKENKVA